MTPQILALTQLSCSGFELDGQLYILHRITGREVMGGRITPIELPFALPRFEVDAVQEQTDGIEIAAHSIATVAICPACQRRSRWVHS